MAKLKFKPLPPAAPAGWLPINTAPLLGHPARRHYTIDWREGSSLVICDEDNCVLPEGSEVGRPYVGQHFGAFVVALARKTGRDVRVWQHCPARPGEAVPKDERGSVRVAELPKAKKKLKIKRPH